MKALRARAKNHQLTLVTLTVLAGLLALFAWTAGSWAQSPVPHAVAMEGEDCLSCHQSGLYGAPRLTWDHLGRTNEDCAVCHMTTGAPAGGIPHPMAGREDCLSCHLEGIGSTPGLSGNHLDYTNEECGVCHLPSAAALEPTPIPTPIPTPTAGPVVSPPMASAETCVSCHQLIFADEEHAIFTGQPLGNAEAGEALFGQLCARCHGEDGTTPVGDEGTVINSEAYWSTHDDAAILWAIGAGAEGQMPAFAVAYDGPLSWEEILSLAAFVRSWGPVASPLEMPTSAGTTYVEAIGPLLTERCSGCHGGLAGLTVTDYASLLAGASSGSVIVPGDPDASRIVEVLGEGHFAQLSEAELALLTAWIVAGAPAQ